MVLSAFYVSRASGDFGYDWTDHKDVNSEVGNMDQFNSLLVEAHEKGELITFITSKQIKEYTLRLNVLSYVWTYCKNLYHDACIFKG